MKVIAVVVGALGTIPKKLEVYVEKRGIEVSVGQLQKLALLGTVRKCWEILVRRVRDRQGAQAIGRSSYSVLKNTGCNIRAVKIKLTIMNP